MANGAAFSTPPGLDAFAGLNDLLDEESYPSAATRSSPEAKPVDLKVIEERLKALGPNPSNDAILQAVQEAVQVEVQRRVQEKTDELWTKGKQVLAKMQVKHKEKTQELMEEVASCQQRHQVLAAENEHLKQVLHGLAARFTILGAGGYPKDFSLTPDQSTVAGLSPSQMEETPSRTPYTTNGSLLSEGPPGLTGDAKLPDVPAFPFPAEGGATSPGTPATLSLAEALGQQTPQRTPVSLMSSLSPGMPTPSAEALGASAFPMGIGGAGGMFNFTLRKADGAELGLNVSHHEDDQVLRVEGIRPDGAVEAWNRQCASSGSSKVVIVGDRIINVNSVSFDPEKMLEECRDRQLLKLTVVRAMFPLPKAPTSAKPRANSEFRADAPVFVPAEAPSPTAEAATKP